MIPQLSVIIIIAMQREVITKSMHFMLFVNTKSGDGQGKRYLSVKNRHLKYRFESFREADIFFFDMFSETSRRDGFQTIKRWSSENNRDVRIIICGGDGTIPWVMSEVIAHQIDMTKVIFGILPIGTGNDFCRSLGWGYKPVDFSEDNFSDMGRQVSKWMNSMIGAYDMWDIEVETFENGKIYDIKNQIQIQRTTNYFKKMFSNYFGIGLDARVVYTVQKHRTSYAFFNKVVYGLVGLCNFFKKMKKLEEKVDSFTDSSMSSCENSDSQTSQLRIKTPTRIRKDVILEDAHKKYPIKQGYRGLVCLNCTSYMAGLRKVWQTKSIASMDKTNEQFNPQKYDDGMLQFVGYKSQLNLALERIARSSSKIAQGCGPFEITMKQSTQDEITYMQIDGESIKIKNLKSVKVKKTSNIQNSKIRVMVNKDQQ